MRWTLVLAGALHALVAVWAARVPRPQDESASSDGIVEATIEVEAPPSEPHPSPALPTGELSEPQASLSGATALRATLGHAPSAASVEAPPGPAASSEPGAADGSWTFSPTIPGSPAPGTGALSGSGLGSATQGAVGAVVAEDVKKRQAFARSHGVLPTFTPHDLELGIVPGGQLVSITRDLVRRSLTPDTGRALLEFDTDGKGVIASVRVLDASSDRREWDRVAAQIMNEARATAPLQVPGGASGLSVTLEVTSAMKTVNGSSATGRSTLGKVWGAVSDPLGTAADATTPPLRVVASRIVDVRAF